MDTRRYRLLSMTAAALTLMLASSAQARVSGRAATGSLSTSDLNRFVTRAMQRFGAPGVALAVVKDGKVLFIRGYGVRALGRPERIDGQTLFSIGSNTKAFTALALAQLVDQDKITWSDKAADRIPRFGLMDPFASREMTVEDLLAQHSGLSPHSGDMMVSPMSDLRRSDLITALHQVPRSTSFRSAYAYQNVLFATAGEIVPATTGQSWESYVQANILDRAGMTRCRASDDVAPPDINFAEPHATIDGRLQAIAPSNVSAIAPAASVRCDAQGLTRWVLTWLDQGRTPDGAMLVAPDEIVRMTTPHTIEEPQEDDVRISNTHFRNYGMGWHVDDYDGYRRVYHGGNNIGFMSIVSMLPELNLGLVVLSNRQERFTTLAIATYITKSFTHVRKRDWLSEFGQMQAKEERDLRQWDAARAELEQEKLSPPQPLSHYLGQFHDPWRGEAIVLQEAGGLYFRLSHVPKPGRLIYSGKGEFILHWPDFGIPSDARVRFVDGTDGLVDHLEMVNVSDLSGMDYENLKFHRGQ